MSSFSDYGNGGPPSPIDFLRKMSVRTDVGVLAMSKDLSASVDSLASNSDGLVGRSVSEGSQESEAKRHQDPPARERPSVRLNPLFCLRERFASSNAKFDGLGKFVWPDGMEYDGEWKNDKRNGEGFCRFEFHVTKSVRLTAMAKDTLSTTRETEWGNMSMPMGKCTRVSGRTTSLTEKASLDFLTATDTKVSTIETHSMALPTATSLNR